MYRVEKIGYYIVITNYSKGTQYQVLPKDADYKIIGDTVLITNLKENKPVFSIPMSVLDGPDGPLSHFVAVHAYFRTIFGESDQSTTVTTNVSSIGGGGLTISDNTGVNGSGTTTPTSPPIANPNIGDIHVEIYDDATLYFTATANDWVSPTVVEFLSSSTASLVTVTPSGNLVSTNVQDALIELQTEIDGIGPGGGLTASDIDTLAELNAIITDATLIDTGDPRLSDARTPLAHTHIASEITDFDTEVSDNASVVANTAKVTNATHTGEVTGSTALVLDGTAISNKSAVAAGGGEFVLIESGGSLRKATTQSIADLAPGGGGDALVANPLSQFAATTSAQLAGVISDESGTGLLVFNTSPVLVTPDLGTPSAAVLTNATGLVATTGLTATGTKDGTTVLHGDNTWKAPAGGGLRKDTWRLSASDMISALFVRDDLDYVIMPYNGDFTDLLAYAYTAPTGSGITVDVTLNGTSIFSTLLTIDAGGNSSDAATVSYVLSTSSFVVGDVVAINIDAVGSTTTGKGLSVQIETTQTS